jgi:hypothetical protein
MVPENIEPVKPQNANPPPSPAPKETDGDDEDAIPGEVYSQVKKDLFSQKEKNRQLQERLDAIEADKMKQSNQWKEFAAAKENEAKEWKEKYESLSGSRLENAKFQAVKDAALKLGLREEAVSDLESMEFKDIMVEETSRGRLIVHGAKAAAEKLKSSKSHWFSDPKVPVVNGSIPPVKAGADGKITLDELNKISAEAKKTGDYSVYKQKLLLFKQQSK